ncbi:hypothetical protein ACP8HZ_02595 [Francisella noatunensis]
MPKNKEYCDQYPEICKYNMLIIGDIIYREDKDTFDLSFKNTKGNRKHNQEELKTFINYMKQKGKYILINIKADNSKINWKK